MNFAQFLLQTDAWRMILVEARPGQHITPFTWTQKFPAPFGQWSGRKLIALPIPTANLTDFPEKVPIVGGTPESIAIGAACRADGFDIRFTAADGATELPYERESWSGGGGAPVTAIFWVKTNVATAGTYIWCYYGNPDAADGENPEAAWDDDFKAVYHMKDATTSTILDSTANNNDGTKKGANEPIEATGIVGKGQDFDGSNDHINLGDDATINPGTSDFMIGFSIKTIKDTGVMRLVTRRGSEAVWFSVVTNVWSTGELAFETSGGVPTRLNPTIFDGNPHRIVITKSGTIATYYIDGTYAGTTAASADVGNDGNVVLGAWEYTPGSYTNFLDGLLDEVRMGLAAPSADWIAYEYANMNPADGGLTWGAEEEGFPNLWSTPYIRVVDSVNENDAEYIERFTLVECDNNASSFYYDYDNGLLCLHTSGSDAPDIETIPGTSDYTLVALSWRYYCNAHYKDFKAIYPRLTEALLDGGFEEWANAVTLDRWAKTETGTSTINRETTGVHGGGYCIRIDVDASNSYVRVSQTHRLLPSGKTRLTVWYKTDVGKTAGLIVLSVGQAVWLQSDGSWAAGGEIVLPSTNGTWTKYTLDFMAHSDHTNYIIYAGCGVYGSDAASSSIYFDDMSMRIYREDNVYLPYLVGTGAPNIQQAVGEFQDGAMVMEAGALQFLNPGFWYTEDADFLWGQKDIRIRAGAKASDYDDCEQVFFGLTRPPIVTDNIATIETTDRKALLFRDVPPLKYDTTTYPKLDPNIVGQSIPIIYGEFSKVPAVCIDTDNFIFKICSHEVEEITSIWYDDVELTKTIDYTLDEVNGQFTLLFDPQQAFISAGVKGRKCSLDDGTYSTNVVDIFVDLFIVYSGILKRQLDFASLLDLRAQRTQAHCVYIGNSQVTFEIVRQLQAGAIFHTIPLTDGRIAAYRYREGTTSSTPNLKSVELSNFQKAKAIETVYRDIEIGYAFDVVAGTFSFVRRTNADVERLHNIKETLSVMTTLKILVEAENVADFYQALSAFPMKKISATIPSKAFNVQAGPGKLVITKSKPLESGDEQSVLLNAPYRVTDIKKNLHTGTVDIEAIDDLQSGGSLICENCYACQVCNEVQEGVCSSCYACELCNTGQTCDECQVCYYCEKCNVGECTSCELCDTCEECDVCQTTQCSICVNCELGDVCSACLACYYCEECNVCQGACYLGEKT